MKQHGDKDDHHEGHIVDKTSSNQCLCKEIARLRRLVTPITCTDLLKAMNLYRDDDDTNGEQTQALGSHPITIVVGQGSAAAPRFFGYELEHGLAPLGLGFTSPRLCLQVRFASLNPMPA
jgi:hypothetical protein